MPVVCKLWASSILPEAPAAIAAIHRHCMLLTGQLRRLILFSKEIWVKQWKFRSTLHHSWKIWGALVAEVGGSSPCLLKPQQLHLHSTIVTNTMAQFHFFSTDLCRQLFDKNSRYAGFWAENSGSSQSEGGPPLFSPPSFWKALATTDTSYSHQPCPLVSSAPQILEFSDWVLQIPQCWHPSRNIPN